MIAVSLHEQSVQLLVVQVPDPPQVLEQPPPAQSVTTVPSPPAVMVQPPPRQD